MADETKSNEKVPSIGDKKNAVNIATGTVEPFFENSDDEFERGQVFKQVKDGVNFRTVGWFKTSVIFLKGVSPNTYIGSSTNTCSDICYWRSQYPNRHALSRRRWRCVIGHRMDGPELLLRSNSRRLPELPCWVPQHRRYGWRNRWNLWKRVGRRSVYARVSNEPLKRSIRAPFEYVEKPSTC
jgi:hypothetical protein